MIKIEFDVPMAAKGMGLTIDEWVEVYMDGRRISMIIEKRISKLKGYKKASSEGDPYDVIDPENKKGEVRCLTNKVMFRPSNQIGDGRRFDESKFYEHKISKVDYFMIADINEIDLRNGIVNVFNVPSILVWDLYKQGKLGKSADKGRKSFLKLMKELNIYNP